MSMQERKPLTVADLIRLIEYVPKDAYIILPGRCAEACYYTRELDKPEKDGGKWINVVKII